MERVAGYSRVVFVYSEFFGNADIVWSVYSVVKLAQETGAAG